VIIDLEKFVREEQACWSELENILDTIEENPEKRFTLAQSRRFHYVYQRTIAGLARIEELPSERETRRYLEGLVARGYGEIHEADRKSRRFRPLKWFTVTFPRTFRRHIRSFMVALAVITAGGLFGAGAVALDPEAKEVLLPFEHLLGDPSERVAEEEQVADDEDDHLARRKVTFSSYLMTHNTRVAIFCMAMGLTFGVGTIILLFYNGVILGAVAFDYIRAGESVFLMGWLLPHGVVEIPAIIIGSQVGLILAAAMIGRSDGRPLAARFRASAPDAVTLIFGTAVLLVWAGIIEAFFSQYHEPVIPYSFKIAFGIFELAALGLFLSRSGRKGEETGQ
jgi:uncharacterized membrane protein SpoIIM required for sporulation